MKSIFRFIYFTKRIYRLACSNEKQMELLWNDLKDVHNKEDWKSGIYEKQKCIETVFNLSDGFPAVYHYSLDEGYLCSSVKVFKMFPAELTTDCFVLATHFNNMLRHGTVVVDPERQDVLFIMKQEYLIPLLYTGEIMQQIIIHHNTSEDIYRAFKRLITEHEAPAVIIGDLLKEKNKDQDDTDEK